MTVVFVDRELPTWTAEVAVWLSTRPLAAIALVEESAGDRDARDVAHLGGDRQLRTVRSLPTYTHHRGPIIVVRPTRATLAAITAQLSAGAPDVCVVRNRDDAMTAAWLYAMLATDLSTGTLAWTQVAITSVVRVAMFELARVVDPSRGLRGPFERAYAVRTFQELRRAGHHFDIAALCGWALANGFTEAEVKLLERYAAQVSSGRSFRLATDAGPRAGTADGWRTIARDPRPRRIHGAAPPNVDA